MAAARGTALPPLAETPNLVSLFFTRAAERGEAPFLWRKAETGWVALSWRAVADRVAALAAALQARGLKPGDRVLLVSENRPEWLIADLAIMAAGGVTVPAYTSNTSADHAHVLENSGAVMAIVSTQALAHRLVPAMLGAGCCTRLIGMDEMRIGQSGSFLFERLEALFAEPATVAACVAGAAALRRDDLACLIYTSGTGGAPRGVRQHHGAILHNISGCARIIDEDFGMGEEVFLSFLPLSHAYEHSAGQFLPIAIGAQIYYAEGLEKLAANIEEVRPTIMVVVPRLFELLRARVVKAIEKQGRVPAWLLDQALALPDQPRPWQRPLDLLLAATIRRRVRARFGGRMKALVSGGAPLNPEVGRFFQSLGLVILQGYGQTEAAPVISCNRPKAGIKLDTVGPPISGMTLRIAEDGEILVRGESVMHGYWRAEQETAQAIDEAGWLHTGDIGHLDEAGRLVITDRKKDIIVNDKGDNVAPQRVEGMLTLQPEIVQAMVSGDRRPYLVALVVPDPEWREAWRRSQGPADEAALVRALQAAVDRVNARLSPIEKIRRIILADEPFTTENGELTPSLKVRRHVLRARYGERLDALYRNAAY
ncbi:AMP-dependent synthetase/ligase [Sphingomonas morindae]|uniref:AMP-dependent synthetase/ligase n=1 Tax=Sphingomonas morindae TaxID=1541170 RepID=A0ABY4X899_9SPHN|nr:AMP-dependent synthetase/ligase [Sphingomonas morindae]USI73156.1 AMP-dependent synthetase/ligase [Sphingomonas morindae]